MANGRQGYASPLYNHFREAFFELSGLLRCRNIGITRRTVTTKNALQLTGGRTVGCRTGLPASQRTSSIHIETCCFHQTEGKKGHSSSSSSPSERWRLSNCHGKRIHHDDPHRIMAGCVFLRWRPTRRCCCCWSVMPGRRHDCCWVALALAGMVYFRNGMEYFFWTDGRNKAHPDPK